MWEIFLIKTSFQLSCRIDTTNQDDEQIRNIKDTKRNILTAKVKWYEHDKNWKEYGKVVIQWIKQYGETLGWLDLNNYAWNFFINITDRTHLEVALTWSSRAIELFSPAGPDVANLMDTKANLLYKLGRRDEAIDLKEKAIAYAKAHKAEFYVEACSQNLNKMKKNQPTWVFAASSGN